MLLGVVSFKQVQKPLVDEVQTILGQLDADNEWKVWLPTLDKAGEPALFESSDYEGVADPLVNVIKEGVLQRKPHMVRGKTYKEHYYVLTAAGFLHEFKARPFIPTCRDEQVATPKNTLFLGDCSLEPYEAEDRKPEEFILYQDKFHFGMFMFVGSSMSVAKEWHVALSAMCKSPLNVADGTASPLGKRRFTKKEQQHSFNTSHITQCVGVEKGEDPVRDD